MKIQCSCGAKYAFDLTPEMAQKPIRFVCQACGLDSSDYVNELIRREFAGQTSNASPPQTASSAAPTAPRLKISREQEPVVQKEEVPAALGFCSKHPDEPATHNCIVCKKPICPKCMQMFGFFCSPFCKNKAEADNLDVPVYAGHWAVVEGQFWRKTGLIFGLVGAVIVLGLGGWTWYAWFGAVPHPALSVRFDEPSYSGGSKLIDKNQFVFLHGGTLARYDLKTKKQIWSQELVTKQQVADQIKQEDDETARDNQKYGHGGFNPIFLPGQREKTVRVGLEGELSLRISGHSIWVGKPYIRPGNQDEFTHYDYKLTHYDWDSGKVLQEVVLPDESGELITRDDELLLVKHTEVGAQFVTHINLADGQSRTEEFHEPGMMTIASARSSGGGGGNEATGGLPLSPGANGDKPLDPEKVAQEAQNLKLPARIALPALLANSAHQQEIQRELKDDDSQNAKPARQKQREADSFTLIPSKYGYLQFAMRMLEEHIVTREAMKAPPKKSVLNGDLTVSKTTEAANEILNEMQRKGGGDTVSEDESRYRVTIRRPDSTEAADWTGEVIGPPSLHPLKTVNVLTAGKTVIVFDKSNKKLWEATLTYDVFETGGEFDDEESRFGEGPCAEHGDTLYVTDQAVLTAFDLATGQARWRLPSVGVAGLFFDDKGMVYVNTTSGSPDDIKYSRQIDIAKSTDTILLKVDPKTGRTLWSIKPDGFASYLSGKFIYSVQFYDPGDQKDANDLTAALQKPPYLHIMRINPGNGRTLWEYSQQRAPVDVQFNDNFIGIVFKKEVVVLKYLTF